jgi:hypothetical protein
MTERHEKQEALVKLSIARCAKAVLGVLGLCAAMLVLAVAHALPAIAATTCPRCFGMERLGANLVVDQDMSPAQRVKLQSDMARAQGTVAAFFGRFDSQPLVVACATQDCDQRMKGYGALAITLSAPFVTVVHLASAGANETILTHELSHAELHRIIGVWHLYRGRIPAWVDEGIAVIVSDDPRHLRPGQTAAARCMRRDARLPASIRDWGRAGGVDHGIYAAAACEVLHWAEARGGGKAPLLQALQTIGAGQQVTF